MTTPEAMRAAEKVNSWYDWLDLDDLELEELAEVIAAECAPVVAAIVVERDQLAAKYSRLKEFYLQVGEERTRLASVLARTALEKNDIVAERDELQKELDGTKTQYRIAQECGSASEQKAMSLEVERDRLLLHNQELAAEFAISCRALGKAWREFDDQPESDHSHPDWQVATKAIAERDQLVEGNRKMSKALEVLKREHEMVELFISSVPTFQHPDHVLHAEEHRVRGCNACLLLEAHRSAIAKHGGET